MNVEIINPFIQGAKQILSNVCGIYSKMGQVSIKNKPFGEKINITIGIIGDLKGYVNYSFNSDVALILASKMMSKEINILDNISKSAICELSNIISGNIATLIFNTGRNIDITTPKLSEDYNNVLFEKFISIPLEFEDGKVFEVNVWIEE